MRNFSLLFLASCLQVISLLPLQASSIGEPDSTENILLLSHRQTVERVEIRVGDQIRYKLKSDSEPYGGTLTALGEDVIFIDGQAVSLHLIKKIIFLPSPQANIGKGLGTVGIGIGAVGSLAGLITFATAEGDGGGWAIVSWDHIVGSVIMGLSSLIMFGGIHLHNKHIYRLDKHYTASITQAPE